MDRKRKILVVEDDKAIARCLKDLLQAENYNVRVAHTGHDAVGSIFSFAPHLVLLDVNLPDLSGFEVCRHVRARGFRNPILMLTARGDQADKLVGLESGADDYVTKPFDSREVLARARARLREVDRLQMTRPPGAAPRRPRRLLAVMFTDMKDFSRRMNEDEKLGLALLNKHNAILTKSITQCHGRIIEEIGDAFLVAFENAIDAVLCAGNIQHRLPLYNRNKPAKEHIRCRIGVHLGDVLEVGGKLRGDTVNIAARLQQLASPGRIVISESILQAVKGKLPIHPRRIGSRKVRNIRQPIVVYSIGASTTTPEEQP